MVKTHLSSLLTLVNKFRSILRVCHQDVEERYADAHLQIGIEQLFNQLIRPRMRTFITEVYKDVTYVLDDDSYANAEYQDLVRKRFVKIWEGLVEDYKVGIVPPSRNSIY